MTRITQFEFLKGFALAVILLAVAYTAGGMLQPALAELTGRPALVQAGLKLPAAHSAEVARGTMPGVRTVNKFGETTNADSGVATDIWDRANPTHDQDIWLRPTAARIHTIVSSSAEDNGTSGDNPGMRTCRVYGLPDWDTAEISEDITLNGITGVPTVNSYVIIYRIKGLTWGANEVNTGYITATAATDGTVTAQINPGLGQTQMMIFGIPSTQELVLEHITADALKATGTGTIADILLLVLSDPDTATPGWRQVAHYSVASDSRLSRVYTYGDVIQGPAIVKLQTSSNKADTTVTATGTGLVFDL